MAKRHVGESAFVGGELVRFLARVVGLGDLPNPFRDQAPMSEAMRRHLENWQRAKWRGAVNASRE